MKQLLAMSLIITMADASAALAGEPLVASAVRAALASESAAPLKTEPAAKPLVSYARSVGVRDAAVAAQQAGAISSSGMRTRTKAMIILGAIAAYAGIAYGIDHNVQDVTPSSLGTREDDSVFNK